MLTHLLTEARRKREQAAQARRLSVYVSLDVDRVRMVRFAEEMDTAATALEQQASVLGATPPCSDSVLLVSASSGVLEKRT
jgi:hypothetical protein